MEKVLIVVDMQNDFIDGSLGTKEAQGIVENVIKKISEYKIENVFATRDTHSENYLESKEGQYLPVIHCVKNTKGWQINEDVEKALKGATIIDKPNFGSLELSKVLKEKYKGKEIEIELIGLCTDICVISNAIILKAEMPDVTISVDSSCCAGVSVESHNASLLTMKMCQIEVK